KGANKKDDLTYSKKVVHVENMRKSKGEQSERKEWNLQWDDSETETIMFFQPLASEMTAKQRGRGCEEGRRWFEPSRSYLSNTPTVAGGSEYTGCTNKVFRS
ncbi:hypothetical protein PIB30_098304, partial [Stylosanthes scabra]|nr:hypothetical protein [Stylosanthes scabra]